MIGCTFRLGCGRAEETDPGRALRLLNSMFRESRALEATLLAEQSDRSHGRILFTILTQVGPIRPYPYLVRTRLNSPCHRDHIKPHKLSRLRRALKAT